MGFGMLLKLDDDRSRCWRRLTPGLKGLKCALPTQNILAFSGSFLDDETLVDHEKKFPLADAEVPWTAYKPDKLPSKNLEVNQRCVKTTYEPYYSNVEWFWTHIHWLQSNKKTAAHFIMSETRHAEIEELLADIYGLKNSKTILEKEERQCNRITNPLKQFSKSPCRECLKGSNVCSCKRKYCIILGDMEEYSMNWVEILRQAYISQDGSRIVASRIVRVDQTWQSRCHYRDVRRQSSRRRARQK